jgi:Ca-activated chloride channel family protein|tara:strand:+ start:1105 stop:2934 length:1830 start_codon:yes stop_codon:yes gene_type:complete
LFDLTLDSALNAWQVFHFLRPWWFLGLAPVALIVGFYSWHKHHAGNWATIINPELLPFLMQGKAPSDGLSIKSLITTLTLAWIICITSLAGPTWEQLPQPVHRQDSALIIVFDLSPSMLAADLAPSRLVRGRYKLIDILKRRTEGVSGLVVYGGDAHTVSPLTEDSNTIVSLVPVLHPGLLPQYGSNVEDAIQVAVNLATSGGYQQADILLISDGVDPSAISEITSIIKDKGEYRLSILGVGTENGAPIPLGSGGFVKDTRSGNVIIPKLNISDLRRLASANNGNYQTISNDDRDIDNLLGAMESLFGDSTQQTDRSFDLWDDQGYLLALLLIPILLLTFRKGAVVVLLLAPLLFQSNSVEALEWQDLWATGDQQGAEALELDNAERAKSLFTHPQWRGSAAYRAADYETAAEAFFTDETANGLYNSGNALAKSGDFDIAIEAYERALELEPALEDAIFNRDLLEKLKQEQEQEQEEQSQEQQDQESSEQQQEQDSEQSDKNGDPSDEQPPEQESEQQDESATPEEESEEESEKKEQQESEKKQNESEQQAERQTSELEMSEEEKQEQREIDAMLRRIPDDPGGLLRAKFRYESQQRKQQRSPPDQERW